MRLFTLTPFIIAAALAAGLAFSKPALAQSYNPAWERERAAAAQAQRDANRDSLEFQREQRARDQRARTAAVLRDQPSDELAGGPSAAPLPPYRPSAIAPMEPPRPVTPLTPSADQARMDALMAEAMARSQARVRATTPDGNP